MTKIPACAIQRVWGYPPPAEDIRPGGSTVHWAWACRCGKHGDGYESEEDARAAAARHFDANSGGRPVAK